VFREASKQAVLALSGVGDRPRTYTVCSNLISTGMQEVYPLCYDDYVDTYTIIGRYDIAVALRYKL
jgi:hypothetical protein